MSSASPKSASRAPCSAMRVATARSFEESACGIVVYAMVNMKKTARIPHLGMTCQQHWTLQQPSKAEFRVLVA